MKQELLRLLAAWNVNDVTIDREASIQGRPATQVKVLVGRAEHEFHFAKDNVMSTEAMANVISSYLNEGDAQ